VIFRDAARRADWSATADTC